MIDIPINSHLDQVIQMIQQAGWKEAPGQVVSYDMENRQYYLIDYRPEENGFELCLKFLTGKEFSMNFNNQGDFSLFILSRLTPLNEVLDNLPDDIRDNIEFGEDGIHFGEGEDE